MRLFLAGVGVLLLPGCRALAPTLLAPAAAHMPLRLPALMAEVSLQQVRPRADSATIAQDIHQLFDRELREVLTTPADSTRGLAVLNVRCVRYGGGQGYTALSGFSFCSLNLLGLPIARYHCTADVQLDIRNRRYELLGTYYAQGKWQQCLGLYYRPWYSEKAMPRVAYLQAVRQGLTQILPQLQAELPQLCAALAE